MRLLFFPVNAAWAFVFGKDLRTAQPVSMGTAPRFFPTRWLAKTAAEHCGLSVSKRGHVSVA